MRATYDLSTSDRNYSTFLKHFGQFTVPKLEEKEISADKFIIERLNELTHAVERIERQGNLGRIDRDKVRDRMGIRSLYFNLPDQASINRFMAYANQNLSHFPGVEWIRDDQKAIVTVPNSYSLSKTAKLKIEIDSAIAGEIEHSQNSEAESATESQLRH